MKRIQKRSADRSWKLPAPGQVRVYVWEWPVRFSHWLLVGTIVSLSITGYYMHSPYIVARGREAYVMGTMRFIHILSGYVFLLAILIRLAWFFLGNRWSHWREYVPVTKKRWDGLRTVGKYYAFLAWSPIAYIGHNPLAGLAYAVVYAMVIVEILTGFALYSQVVGSPALKFFIGWLPRLIDIQYLREIHFLIMFGFWMFFIHHLYTAVLISIEEQSGLMDSIFSGYKYVPAAHLRKELEDTQDSSANLLVAPPPSLPAKAHKEPASTST